MIMQTYYESTLLKGSTKAIQKGRHQSEIMSPMMDGSYQERTTKGFSWQCADCGLIWEKRWHAETCGDDGRNHHASFAQGPYGVTYVLDGVPQGNIKYYTRFAIGRGKA